MNKEPICVDSYSISYVGFFCPWKYILFMDFFDHSFFGGRNSWKGKWKDTFFSRRLIEPPLSIALFPMVPPSYKG